MLDLFREIRSAFPDLGMTLEEHPEHVDISMDIPEQRGVDFAVSLNWQGDELHLHAGALWLQYFPCYEARVKQDYLEVVKSLLKGQFRIIEHRRGNRAVKAELQRPTQAAWETIYTWGLAISIPFPRKELVVVQNRSAQ